MITSFSHKVKSFFMLRKNGIILNINSGDVVITVNRRLSTHLQYQFEQQQLGQRLAWPSPGILPLSQWLGKLWSYHYPNGILLDKLAAGAEVLQFKAA